jgi:hypothetical protein
MSMPNPDPLLVATWANEETIAEKGGAADARHHIAEDYDAARSRAAPTRSRARSALAWIRARFGASRQRG